MIEKVTTQNFEEVLPLIREYQEFYNVTDIDDEKNREFFSHSGGVLHIIRHEETAVGFSTVYFGFSSTRAEKVGILNDVYITVMNRRNGLGRKLIEHALNEIRSRGINRLQWLTMKNNKEAQRLYDSFKPEMSEWFYYSIDINN